MNKSLVSLLLAAAVVALVVAWRVDGGAPTTASAVGTVREGPANAELIGSSQSWKIISKADFPANRVVVRVVAPNGDEAKVVSASFTCQGTKVAGVLKRENDDIEVWSGDFPDKCIQPGGSVNLTLVPADPKNKVVIRRVVVQNTTDMHPIEGEINFDRIRRNPQLWKIVFKDEDQGFNRIVLAVRTGASAPKVRHAKFTCQHPHRVVQGEMKLRFGGIEFWSGTFPRKCRDGVTVEFVPTDSRNQIVVLGGRAINTTHLVPRQGPANAVLKGKTQSFKVTSKADFAANRVEIDIGSNKNTPQISSASFQCQTAAGAGPKVDGELKSIDKDANPTGDALPNHEVWSGEFDAKCIAPNGGGVTVTIVPKDPRFQVVIKGARVQNTLEKPTATPTPTSMPTPPGTNGSCDLIAQGVPIPHRPDQPLWDEWKCTPSVPGLDWNRVDILVGKPTQDQKVKAVQFDCQSNDAKANDTILKGHVKGAAQDMELWSGEDFKDANGLVTNCQDGVTVLLTMFDPANHPPIKKAFFSHVGPPKPTPKPESNGLCQANDAAGLSYTCRPNAVAGPFVRVDLKIGKPTKDQKLSTVVFTCLDSGEVQTGQFKGTKNDANPGTTLPHHEIWSADFIQPCFQGVDARLVPVDPANVPHVIGVVFSS